jgi:excisionase family DNA binding protein/prepilin-type N-terminal cleavage/methylation domain-containing protein
MEIRNPKMVSLVCRKAFSLLETVMALAILALISSSVFVVINRCMTSMADSALRMEAFEVARDNMEKLLALNSVQEMVEYGSSEKNPDIQWQTTVESFYEPLTSRMWIRAVCEAEYTDMAEEVQTVELTHWLTSLTKKQVLKVVEQRKKELERLAEADQIIKTVQEAAEYVGVDVETIQQWVNFGDMPITESEHYVKIYLDLFNEYDGNPPAEARIEADEAYGDLTGRIVMPGGFVPTGWPQPRGGRGPKPDAPGASQDTFEHELLTQPTASDPGSGSSPQVTRNQWIEDYGLPSAWYDFFFPDAPD